VSVLVLSDTHIGAGGADKLVRLLGRRLRDAEAILHAGDITDREVLALLSRFAPTYAVLGNNDHGLPLPQQRIVELRGRTIGMVHDSGDAIGRGPRLHRWFPDADVVVFGHSHLPWNEVDERAEDGHRQLHLNPGSPTQRRRAPRCTIAWLDLADGEVVGARHEPVS
jgi:putative phosphoesterase